MQVSRTRRQNGARSNSNWHRSQKLTKEIIRKLKTLDNVVGKCRAAKLSQEHANTVQKEEELFKVEVVSIKRNGDKYTFL